MPSRFRKFIGSVKGFFGGTEGAWNGPFTGYGEFGNPFVLGRLEDGWQRNISRLNFDHTKVPIVYSCVQAYSRAVSTCTPQHIRIDEDGRHQLITNSWLSRLLRSPNSYETWHQFIFNIVAEMGFRGPALAVMVRDASNRVVQLHRIPHGGWSLYVEPDTREVFYSINTNSNSLSPEYANYMVPARDVIHFRQHCPRHPLLAESPITAAAMAVGINVTLSASQAAFFAQMRRPSGVLTTDKEISKEQMKRLREAFDEQSKRWEQGGMPILSNGLKFQALSISSVDSQLIDAQKLTREDICGVYAIPQSIVSINDNISFKNSETLLNHWLSTGLGSLVENLEQSLSSSLGLNADEYVNLDTDNLMRLDAETKINMLTKGVSGGVFAPNEARRKLDLPDVDGGDTVFLQQQNFPIDLLEQYAALTVANQMNGLNANDSGNPVPDPVDSGDGQSDGGDGQQNDSADQSKRYLKIEIPNRPTLDVELVKRITAAKLKERLERLNVN